MNFQKHILTKGLCEDLGHIAWVEDRNPVSAIQEMLASVSSGPLNVAIWPNSHLNIGQEVTAAIAEWRSKFFYTFSGETLRGLAPDKISGAINTYFERVVNKSDAKLKIDASARDDFTRGARALESFVTDRTSQIVEATQPRVISVRPKVSEKYSSVFEKPNLHVDRQKEHIQFRFLDAISCPHTMLPRKRDVTPNGSDGYYQFTTAAAEGFTDIFECPPGSLILLSQSPENPIVHTQPFICERGQLAVPRTTVTYDIAF